MNPQKAENLEAPDVSECRGCNEAENKSIHPEDCIGQSLSPRCTLPHTAGGYGSCTAQQITGLLAEEGEPDIFWPRGLDALHRARIQSLTEKSEAPRGRVWQASHTPHPWPWDRELARGFLCHHYIAARRPSLHRLQCEWRPLELGHEMAGREPVSFCPPSVHLQPGNSVSRRKEVKALMSTVIPIYFSLDWAMSRDWGYWQERLGHSSQAHCHPVCRHSVSVNDVLGPSWCGSLDWVLACEPKGHWFNSLSGHMPGL